MTEAFIRSIAERFGLEVLKRITTGETRKHFATFELIGLRAADAWESMKHEGRGRAFDSLRRSDIDTQPYIECQSVWCEYE